jgi:hypothetical protein
VHEALTSQNATPDALRFWNELVDEVIVMPETDDDLTY